MSVQHSFLWWNERNINQIHRTSFCGLEGGLKISLAIIRAQYMSGNYEGEPVHFSFWMWPDQVLLLSRFLWIAQAAPNLIHGHCTGLNTGDTFWSTSHPKSPRFSSQTSHLSRGWIQWTIGNWCLTHLRENLLAK